MKRVFFWMKRWLWQTDLSIGRTGGHRAWFIVFAVVAITASIAAIVYDRAKPVRVGQPLAAPFEFSEVFFGVTTSIAEIDVRSHSVAAALFLATGFQGLFFCIVGL